MSELINVNLDWTIDPELRAALNTGLALTLAPDSARALAGVFDEFDRRAELIKQLSNRNMKLTRERNKIAGWHGIDLAEIAEMDL